MNQEVMFMNQIKKNFIYNVFYQILIIILPLITIPYVSRVLGSEGVGIYSYTYSIVYYFMLISMLGINNYGNRTIAKARDDKEKLSKAFISIYSIQLFMSILMIMLYIIYILIFDNKYLLVASIQIIYIISAMFDINWFFFGLEKFKLTVVRSTLVKILSLIGIFVFIKTKNDVWLYALILSLSTLVSNILLIPFLLKEINIIKISFKDIKKHIKPILILFIPVIAVSLYRIMDKIMLGLLSNINEVGYYEQADKMVTVPLGIITALGTVMLPRISNLVAKGENKRVLEYIKKSVNFMMFLAFPMCFGMIAVSNDFIPIFLGEDFIKTGYLVNYISFIIIFTSFANIIRTQYLIPKEKDKIYTLSVIGGAVTNLIINFILIPKYQSIGAAIGTIAAELYVMVYQVYKVRKELPIKDYLKDILPLFIKALIMFIIILSIKCIPINPLYRVILQIVIGILIYVLLNYKYILEITNIKNIFKKKVIK